MEEEEFIRFPVLRMSGSDSSHLTSPTIHFLSLSQHTFENIRVAQRSDAWDSPEWCNRTHIEAVRVAGVSQEATTHMRKGSNSTTPTQFFLDIISSSRGVDFFLCFKNKVNSTFSEECLTIQFARPWQFSLCTLNFLPLLISLRYLCSSLIEQE